MLNLNVSIAACELAMFARIIANTQTTLGSVMLRPVICLAMLQRPMRLCMNPHGF